MAAAKAAGRAPTYQGTPYCRRARRIGANRAALAVAHSIIVIICHHVINHHQDYVDLGDHYFEQRDRDAMTKPPCNN